MRKTTALCTSIKAMCLGLCICAQAFAADLSDQLKLLQDQNQKLQQQLDQQKAVIEQLQRTVNRISAKQGEPPEPPPPPDSGFGGLLTKPFSSGNIVMSGEGALAFFSQPPHGAFPNSEFRVDEAKLFFDVKLWDDVYFFTELNVTTREDTDEYAYIGELYVDFENIFPSVGERLLNFRLGRFDIPFGEEYMGRDAIDNPLVSHSLSDIWGVDEGLELYGSIDKWHYALAVQNGGLPSLHDYDPDKSFSGRISYQPASWLSLSASGMRTGNINTKNDQFSALWFGGGFFEALAPAADKFHADLFEGDTKLTLSKGYAKAAGGYVRYADSSPSRDRRDLFYYYTEGLYDFTPKFYSSARFSQIFARDGFPLVGAGDFGERMFGPFTTDLWRLSLGLGYRWSKDVIGKIEYSFNGGKTVNGIDRSQENLFGAEIAVKF